MKERYTFVKNVDGPPANAVCLGYQSDGSGKYWSAVAHTDEHGDVGGKANKDTCWYPFYGREHTTENFSWLVPTDDHVVLQKHLGSPPPDAVKLPQQGDDSTVYYAAIADTRYGLIPGHAHGLTCRYPYNHWEEVTKDFFWLVAK